MWSYREYIWLPVHVDPALTKQMDERIGHLLPSALQVHLGGSNRIHLPPIAREEDEF